MNTSIQYYVSEAISKIGLLCLCIGFYKGYPPFQRNLAWVEADRHREVLEATVPEWMAGVIGAIVVVCGFALIATGLLLKNHKEDYPMSIFWYKFLEAVISFFSTMLTTWAFVEPLKRFMGEPRPHFLARCYDGIDNIPDLVEIPIRLSNKDCWELQTNPGSMKWDAFDKLMNEDRMSFPSAHSALMAALFTWMGLYSYNLGYMLNVPAYTGIGSMLMIFFACPTTYIATSRIRDQWHHPHDVLLGLLFGSVIAFWQYSVYFPAVPRCEPHEKINALSENARQIEDVYDTSPESMNYK